MASQQGQGTGHDAHKSSEEPYPHKEAPSTRGESRGSESSQSSSRSSARESQSGSSSRSSSESSDLKSREYRDKEGNVHHHTRTSESMKGSGSGKNK